ncbi:MAG: glycoside hydrolase family 92 protein, partial [Bacteroidetes bacterium]
SGTGIGDLCDILLMPTVGEVALDGQIKSRDDYPYASPFSHAREQASPGYYEVFLEKPGVEVDLTATAHTGWHRYRFPETGDPSVVIDLGFAINWDKPTEAMVRLENETTLVGYRHSTGWAKDQRLFFVAEFSRPIGRVVAAINREMQPFAGEVAGEAVAVQCFVAPDASRELLVKVGLSSASVEGARAALAAQPGWDFDAVQAAAAAEWEAALGTIRVETDDADLRKTFYTALYHSQLAPVRFSDPMGQYKGVDGEVKTATGYTRYDIFSLWDTFRAANPLFTLTQPERVNDMIRSMLAHYEEYGLLPVWALLGNETNTMTGYHAIPVIVEAYHKGFRDWDAELAFEAMKKSAMQDIRGTNFLREYQYIPHDKAGQSVTRTLEYCYDDWCIAQMAKALGKDEDYAYFMDRASWYRNLYDASTGFMRAKLADGSWKVPFDPQYSSHDFDVAEYTEGNAWQHSWFVPHDPQGLIDLHGGREPFITKLDSLFEIDSEIRGEFASADISGLVGQYAHGNEPSHHIAYLYSYAGAPAKAADRLRHIMATQYSTAPDGLCGNEDCGQMSAWYVFSAMGFYPVNPAEGVYVLGSPLFARTEIDLPGGKTFALVAEGVSQENRYIQAATLNGQPLERVYLTHEEVVAGGELLLQMGPEPHPTWGTAPEAAPPSMSAAM